MMADLGGAIRTADAGSANPLPPPIDSILAIEP
jgi:hypothetical protein